jgi:hypothetical protein
MDFATTKDAVIWLKGNPPLHELMKRCPAEWEEVGRELVSTLEGGRAQRLSNFAASARSNAEIWNNRIRKSRNNPKVVESALPVLLKSRMALLALEKCFLAAATGTSSGKIRFNLINGFIIQKLLFSYHLTRKAASLFWFRFWWPLISQKRILMPLVQPKGIYCFYSSKLIKELSALIGARPCLEVAAGDGTLARFLTEAGTNVRATDNHSWAHAIQYPTEVEKVDARKALEKFGPQAVVCSWPPPGNRFEQYVFSTPSVDLYIVIGSRYSFASGNWEAYGSQRHFEWARDDRLSSYVIPAELDSAVLVFRRKKPS